MPSVTLRGQAILGGHIFQGVRDDLLKHKKKNPEDIFGYTDAMKLRSSMTLFELVSEDDSVFHNVLQQFYNGEMDELTIKLANK